MTYEQATRRYRGRAGDDFQWPDYQRSFETGGNWHLRDADGEPIAIVAKDGRILSPGTIMTSPPDGDAA